MPFFDGTGGRLHYRRWPAPGTPAAVLAWLPGMGQHSGHYHRFARRLAACGIETWGLDTAGQGLSEGDADAARDATRIGGDARRFVELVRAEGPAAPLIVAGHSLGARTALQLLPSCTALVLTGTPATALAAHPALPPDLPILALHGCDDRRAPVDAVRDWAARRASVRLIEYPDAGHDLLHEPVYPQVTDAIAEWIRQLVDAAATSPRGTRR
ncbi:alpha/beta hydrolase [Nocardia stercoris]|uniref:Alpha/beta hydrolase n=1 Tax=Nocardia stercoris TaxID=2483361 RepID=A0A3M2L670_9NOCA|nr:alpha/beta hydrolase [Nocardia stercoris]RMI31405.1 alpha/beta hydrolase [Nocardia stercoris]